VLRIEIIGNLGSEPEQRFTNEGVSMTSIRVAVNSRPAVPTASRSSARIGSACGPWARKPTTCSALRRDSAIGRLEIGEWQPREGERGNLHCTQRRRSYRAGRFTVLTAWCICL